MTTKKKPVPPESKSPRADKSGPVIVLGSRDGLHNMPASIDGKPAYVYRAPDGTWKSTSPAGRRKFGPEMQQALEAVYALQVSTDVPIQEVQKLLSDDKALHTIGRHALQCFISSAYSLALSPERPWSEVEVNPFTSIQSLRDAISEALRSNGK